MEIFMKIHIERTTTVMRKVWGPDDEYLAIQLGDIQVHEPECKEGQRVKVEITITSE
jgi:hypothetical protein